MRGRHWVMVAGCTLLGLCSADEVRAQIVKCVSGSGEISYTQGACPAGTHAANLPQGVSADSASASNQREPQTEREFAAEAKCKAGDQKACGWRVCDGLKHATESALRRCARARGFPSGDNWAQVDDSPPAFLCFATVSIAGSPPEHSEVLVQPSREGGFQANDPSRKVFPTMEEAASYSCVEQVGRTARELSALGLNTQVTSASPPTTAAANAQADALLRSLMGPAPGFVNVYSIEGGRHEYHEAIANSQTGGLTVLVGRRVPPKGDDTFRPQPNRDQYELLIRDHRLIMKFLEGGEVSVFQAPIVASGVRVITRGFMDNGPGKKADLTCLVKPPTLKQVLGKMRKTVSSQCEALLRGGYVWTSDYLFAEGIGLVKKIDNLEVPSNMKTSQQPSRMTLIAINDVAH